jgi:tRNA(Arg) A34 adenosine deaminase TadA
MPLWDSLTPAWRACWAEGWATYVEAGNYPIGAAVVDGEGNVCSRGRNHIRGRGPAGLPVSDHELAHAEVNALLTFGHRHAGPTYSLYTLLEPCPLCMGAFYMSGVRQLHFAARDPLAGSASLLGKTDYMARKPIRVFATADAALESLFVPVLVATMHEMRGAHVASMLEWWGPAYPEEVAAGRALFESGTLADARARGLDSARAMAMIETALAGRAAGEPGSSRRPEEARG